MGMKKLCVALAAIALGAVTVAPASAAQEGNQIVQIENVAYGECLQLTGQAPSSGLGIGACTDAQDQRWELIELGDGKHMMRNLFTRRCVDDDFYLQGRPCDDEAVPQYAELVADRPGTVRIKFGSRYVASVMWSDGRRDVWPTFLRDSDEQRWRLRSVGTTTPVDTTGQTVRISAVDNMGCISLRDGSWLTPAPCADVPEQKFQRVELGDGKTAFRSVVNNKCIASDATSAVVNVLNDCAADATAQQWAIEENKTGAVRIRESAGQRYLMPVTGDVFAWERRRDYNTWQSWELLRAA